MRCHYLVDRALAQGSSHLLFICRCRRRVELALALSRPLMATRRSIDDLELLAALLLRQQISAAVANFGRRCCYYRIVLLLWLQLNILHRVVEE